MEYDTRSIPKVKLDSHADAMYISEAFRVAAKRAVQQRATSVADSEDLFNRAQSLVEKSIELTMIASADSIQINGIDWMPSMAIDNADVIPDMEPYDEGLNRRLQELQVELERQTIKVTQQRKTVPSDIKETLQRLFQSTALPARSHLQFTPSEDEFAENSPASHPLLESVHKDYQSALSIMAQLAKDAPANLSALQRACDIVGELQHSTKL